MNKTEQKAYKWLKSQGYVPQDIIFQSRKTPDFLTTDGKGYEVKLVYGKTTVWMFQTQFDTLKSMSNASVIVFRSNSDEPVTQIPVSDLEPGLIRDGVKIVVAKNDTVGVRIDDDLKAWLMEHRGAGTVSSAIRELIEFKETEEIKT